MARNIYACIDSTVKDLRDTAQMISRAGRKDRTIQTEQHATRISELRACAKNTKRNYPGNPAEPKLGVPINA